MQSNLVLSEMGLCPITLVPACPSIEASLLHGTQLVAPEMQWQLREMEYMGSGVDL